jgi:glycosyltransferase involved in cell wall biosynthesis
MNILVDIRSLLDKPYTGVGQYTLNFLNQRLKADKENNYFLFYNSGKLTNNDLPVFNFPNVQIVDYHWPNKFFNLFLKIFAWPKIDHLVEKKIGKKIDEVILPNFNFVVFSKNLPITLVVHDLSFKIYPHFFNFKQRFWHQLIKPRKICQRANKIIVHAENTKNDLIKFYKIEAAKIEIQQPPINQKFSQEISQEDKNRVKAKYKLPDNFILYLGNLEPRKNLDTLLRAFSQLMIPNSSFIIHLIVAGQGREMLKLKKIVEDLGVGEQVKFLNYVSEEDKVALYHLAKLFVYPSFYEGYGYPVAEALACGLPVITTNNSSLTEINSNRITFINPHDINDLAEAIKASFLT